jgi:hypothetical protein
MPLTNAERNALVKEMGKTKGFVKNAAALAEVAKGGPWAKGGRRTRSGRSRRRKTRKYRR